MSVENLAKEPVPDYPDKLTVSETMSRVDSKAMCISPKGGKLEYCTASLMTTSPFYFGYGGYKCSACGVLSDNMSNQVCFYSNREGYLLCALCASNNQQENKAMAVEKAAEARDAALRAGNEMLLQGNFVVSGAGPLDKGKRRIVCPNRSANFSRVSQRVSPLAQMKAASGF